MEGVRARVSDEELVLVLEYARDGKEEIEGTESVGLIEVGVRLVATLGIGKFCRRSMARSKIEVYWTMSCKDS